MRCKKHPADLSSGVGVCASCLRERLFAIMAAQAQKQAQLHHPEQNSRKSDTQPPPLSFPRSVSPYITRRKTDTTSAAAWQLNGNHRGFHSTPQVGPTGSLAVEFKEGEKKKKRGNGGRFSSLFLGLFRSKPDKRGSNSGPISDPGVSVDSCSASPSWFSSISIGRRKKQIRTFSLDESGGIRGQRRNRDRGMSPARYPDNDDDEHCHGGSSGYSSESSPGWKQTPRRTPAATQRGGGKGGINVSGLAFCLSPLVRASPNRQWNQKGLPPDSVVGGGESRVPQKSHLRTATSFCKNRSRKLADFGRYSYKH